MPQPWCPTFVYGVAGSETTWTATISARPWTRRTPTIGGMRRSATGVQAAYVVRRDANLFLTVRYYESEEADIWALLAWAQSGESFTYYPDFDNDPDDSYEVDLESPAAGTDVLEQRPPEFPMALEITLELHRTDGLPWELVYFPEVLS